MAQTDSTKTNASSAPADRQFPAFSDWVRPESWTRWMSGEPMAKAFEDHVNRMGAMWDEFAKTEKMAMDQAHSAVQEFSRLALAGIDYSARLSGEIRRTTIEASRRGLDFLRNGNGNSGRN